MVTKIDSLQNASICKISWSRLRDVTLSSVLNDYQLTCWLYIGSAGYYQCWSNFLCTTLSVIIAHLCDHQLLKLVDLFLAMSAPNSKLLD